MAAKRRRRAAGPGSPPKRARGTTKHMYKPLDVRTCEIRLLELAPGRPGSRIVGRLVHKTLEEAEGSYDALSYTWGAPRPTYDVRIEDVGTLSVGRNLRKALDDLRHEDKPRLIWTDAICINQGDADERGPQIQLMGAIYGGARAVCAWLDHDVRPMGGAFEDLERLGDGVDLDDYGDPEHWYPVADIFRAEYWRRLWIQQELILARRIEVYCRRSAFDGARLLEFQHRVMGVKDGAVSMFGPEAHLLHYVDNVAFTSDRDTNPVVLGGGIVRARANRAQGIEAHAQLARDNERRLREGRPPDRLRVTQRILSSSLLQLFLESFGLRMTDPRDRVYGVLGLAVDVEPGAIPVDYRTPHVGVYCHVFRHFLAAYASASFLCFDRNSFRGVTPREPGLPSWMPHATPSWSLVNASMASGDTTASEATIDPETLRLTIPGHFVGTVAHTGTTDDAMGIPVRDWLARVDALCRQVWPDDTDRVLFHQREHVSALLFPWLTAKRYQAVMKVARPDGDERARLLRVMVAAADRVEDPGGFTVRRIVQGVFQPAEALSPQERAAVQPLFLTAGFRMLFGTEGRQLGSTTMSSDVTVGDEIWVLCGCRMPMILRRAGRQGRQGRPVLKVVGPAVFPTLMRGEAVGDDATMIELE